MEGRRKYLSDDITLTEWKCYPFIAMFSPSATFLYHRTLLLLLPSFSQTSRCTRPRNVWRKLQGEGGGGQSRRRGGKLRGEMHKFPGTPPASPPGHFSFPFTPLFLSLLLLSLEACFGTNIHLGGILKVPDFRFTGTPINGLQMCSENPC